MNKEKKISIVLPCYNGEAYLEQAIKSIIAQTYNNWELIIVNDCSTDSTQDIIDKYVKVDNRIKCVKNKINLKLPGSLNEGFKVSDGEYLTWTSDDNILKSNFLKDLSDYLSNNKNVFLVYSNYEYIDENSNYLKDYITERPMNMLVNNVVGASFMYRRDVLDKIGEYDTDLFLIEDYEYWLRIFLNFKIARLDINPYQYRVHGGSLTSRKAYHINLKAKEVREMYYDELLRRVKETNSNELLAKFYSTNIKYGVKEKREGFKLAIHYPKYIWMAFKAFARRTKINLEYKLKGEQ